MKRIIGVLIAFLAISMFLPATPQTLERFYSYRTMLNIVFAAPEH